MTLLFRVFCSIYFFTFQLSRCEKVLLPYLGIEDFFILLSDIRNYNSGTGSWRLHNHCRFRR